MRRTPAHIPSRIDAWRTATFRALIAALVMLVVIKLFTGIMFVTAFLFALAVFMIAFGFMMRLTPRRD